MEESPLPGKKRQIQKMTNTRKSKKDACLENARQYGKQQKPSKEYNAKSKMVFDNTDYLKSPISFKQCTKGVCYKGTPDNSVI